MASSTDVRKTSLSLISRVRNNDAEGWRRLVSLYGPCVLQWCRQADLGSADVADMFQEVFQTVAENLDRFHRDRPGDTFRGWLRVVTRNKLNDHFRRHRGEPRGAGGSAIQQWFLNLPAETTGSTAGACADAAELGVLRRALRELEKVFRPHTWRAFWRTAVDGQRPRDVAKELGMTPGAVRVAKVRVLQRLRQELGDING